MHDHHAVSHLERLLLIVRDQHGGDAQLVVQRAQAAAQLLAHALIERAKRLVEQQHLGLDRQRARQRDTLTLTARELRGEATGQPLELHEVEQLVDLGLDLALR